MKNAKSAYFSNAPVGTIFGDIAAKMKIPPIGLYDTQIQQALTTQLTNVETKGTSPDDAFNAALDADQADHRLRPPDRRLLLRESAVRSSPGLADER